MLKENTDINSKHQKDENERKPKRRCNYRSTTDNTVSAQNYRSCALFTEENKY